MITVEKIFEMFAEILSSTRKYHTGSYLVKNIDIRKCPHVEFLRVYFKITLLNDDLDVINT